MDELKELINVVTRHKVKHIEVIGNEDLSQGSLFQLLYDGIRDGRIVDDDTARALLYGSHSNSPAAHKKGSFLKLKNRLKTRLVNTLFFIDPNQPQFNDVQRAFFNCNRNWMAVRLMLSRGARKAGISLAHKTLRIARKFEFTEMILLIAKELRMHYGIIQGDRKQYEKMTAIIRLASSDLEAELLAEEYYTQIMLEFTKSQASSTDVIGQKAIGLSEILKTQYSGVKSFRFIRISYLLHAISQQINHDYFATIDECNEAIEIFENKPYNSQGAIFDFNLRKLSCCIQLKLFDEGANIGNRYIEELPSGSYNWYVILFYYFLLCSHSQNYQQCLSILQLAINHKAFDKFYENQKQLWYVNEAYVHFLIATGKINHNVASNQSGRPFRLYRFLNNIPIYSKDKRGINVAILTIHVLFLLKEKRYNQIIDRVDALNQYCHRYLRRDDTFRANCFIKMLLQIPRADFNRIRTERYASKYLEKLRTMPLSSASQGVETEIIPFEDLWQITLELLE